MDHSRVEK